MTKQAVTGKAFEYSILHEFFAVLSRQTKVEIIENQPYETAKSYFDTFNQTEQGKYLATARHAVEFLMEIEPRMIFAVDGNDILQLEIKSDKSGQAGDVRDILLIRNLQNWEIGVSAKNNHKAVKHSRLSNKIDFGERWLGVCCSSNYFAEISPIFDKLSKMRAENKSTLWSSINNLHQTVYVPVLDAFKNELLKLDKENPGVVAKNLVQYLIGNQDFYKVIKSKNNVEIQAYNINGSLNLAANKKKPGSKIPILKLPTRLIEIVYQENSKTTLLLSMNEGWQISFRIHNASSRVEPSLKFDINLVSTPQTLFTTHKLLKGK